MAKYIDAEKLIKEIKIIQQSLESRNTQFKEIERIQTDCMKEFCKCILDVINSLQQEQPEVDFKIEERKWVHNAVDNIFPEDGDFMSEVDFRKILKDTARHFYELGKNSK